MSTSKPLVPLRRQLYALLIVIAVAAVCSRIAAVTQVYEPYLHHDQDLGRDDPQTGLRQWPKSRPRPVPTFGSNDRSRWATIRALVDDGTYVIGYREDADPTGPNNKDFKDWGIITEDGWKSVDKVLLPEPVEQDGKKVYRFYSSKPPLLPTLLAGEYWLLKQAFGLSLSNPDDVWVIVRVILLTVNAVPLAVFLALLARYLERYGTSDWGRLFVLAAACFGTFLTLFAVTLNNHTVGACFALYALAATLHIWRAPKSGPLWYVLAGLLAAFTATVELPAFALLGLLFLMLLWRDWRPTAYYFVPAALVVVAAALVTNYAALGTVLPAYAEANPEGPDTGFWYKYKGSVWRKDAPDEEVPKRGPDFAQRQGETHEEYVLQCLIGHHGIFSLMPIWFLALGGMVYGVTRFGKMTVAPAPRARLPEPASPPSAPEPAVSSPPVESATPSPAPTVPSSPAEESPFQFGASVPEPPPPSELVMTAPPPALPEETPFNFSGFAVPTAPAAEPKADVPPNEVTEPKPEKAPEAPPGPAAPEADKQRWAAANEQAVVAAVTLVLTAIVVGFYLWRTRNYSGWSNGLRWLFWLIPFWLLTMVPVVDRLAQSRWGRVLGYALLAVSVFSATFRDWNPWRHPWLWQVMQSQGWLPY